MTRIIITIMVANKIMVDRRWKDLCVHNSRCAAVIDSMATDIDHVSL